MKKQRYCMMFLNDGEEALKFFAHCDKDPKFLNLTLKNNRRKDGSIDYTVEYCVYE